MDKIDSLKEKFKNKSDIFWKYYIRPSKELMIQGTNIPFSFVNLLCASNNKGKYINVGDGTINIATLLDYLRLCEERNINTPTDIDNVLNTLERLQANAAEYFYNWVPKGYKPENSIINIIDGFFLRDDCDYFDNIIFGNYKMLHTSEDEDPCHSPFISQDQVWNLNPILMKLNNDYAKAIGSDINGFIKDNKYTIYNPYLSAINHFFTYCPSFNENKVKPWERQADRKNNFKMTVKVKRGANNWYYSGGTKAAYNSFVAGKRKAGYSIRELLYRGTIFVLDRIYDPLYKLITGKHFKYNAYYCYAATSGIWYSSYKSFVKRVAKRFNDSLKEANGDYNKLFAPNVASIVLSKEDVDLDALYRYLCAVPNTEIVNNWVASPLPDMVLYQWYMNMIQAK